jgi:hypothetical protein
VDTAYDVLAKREDLQAFGDNAIVLFALELAVGIEDITSVAATALTDYSNDKSCDLLWVDPSTGRAVIAQGYMAGGNKDAAPANKAAGLHQAVGWILGRKDVGIPKSLLSAAQELWAALDAGEISSLELWYCHNCPESPNVLAEMDSTVNTAKALLSQHWPALEVNLSGREIGQARLQNMFEATQLDIAVRESVTFQIPGSFQESGEDWEALCTTLSGVEVRDLYRKHQSMLFALNVRDYLGLIKSDKNINHNMRSSAIEQPSRFFAYNNGLTVLTTGWERSRRKSKGRYSLRVDGVAIVNGAQTTGVLGNLEDNEATGLAEARVLTRFVKSKNRDVLESIIEYNNSQNRIEASDFRSSDETQEKLRIEFDAVPDAEYRGGRRGGATDVIVRNTNLLSTKTAAQALACFHGDPTAAYHEIGKIWSDNDYYLRTFDPVVSARHVVLCYSLLKATERYKLNLSEIESPTQKQQKVLEYLRLRGGGFMLATAIAANMEEICGITVANPWGLRFKKNLSPADAEAAWMPVVSSLAEFSEQLTPALLPNFRSAQRRDEALASFASLLGAILQLKADAYEDFGKRIECVAVS